MRKRRTRKQFRVHRRSHCDSRGASVRPVDCTIVQLILIIDLHYDTVLTIIPILRRQRRIRHNIFIIRRHEVDEELRRSFHGRVPGCEEGSVASEAVVFHYVEHEPTVGLSWSACTTAMRAEGGKRTYGPALGHHVEEA